MSKNNFIGRLGTAVATLPLLAALVIGAVPVPARAATPPATPPPSLATVTDE